MQKAHSGKKAKILFVVTEDWYFCSHRLPLAIAAINAGFDVSIATRVQDHGQVIRAQGITIYPWEVSRGSTNFFGEIKTLFALLRIYLREQPDIVHQVAFKPALYGSFIAKFIGPSRVVNALGGMGSIFAGGRKQAQWLKKSILFACKWLFSGKKTILILQNPEDIQLLSTEAKIKTQNIRLIRGAGVNVQEFYSQAENTDLPLVILPARMLWDKGVGEYVEAAKILKSEGIAARFALVGGVDPSNPSAISSAQLQEWAMAGIVEWFGLRNDMPAIYRQAHIVCLPSYREGLPKSLLEAAASGRAIVTTNVPGCKEIVKHEHNGLLVPAKNASALATALKELILNPTLRQQFGKAGRQMVLNEFSETAVIQASLQIYRELLEKSDR